MSFSIKGKGSTIAGHYDTIDGKPAGGYTHFLLHGPEDTASSVFATINWQDGALVVDGERIAPNGLFVEDLITAALHRLQYFQEGEFRCRETALAVTKLEEAIHWLAHRTAERESRGVEGTHEK